MAHPIASSLDAAWTSAQPPISSFASEKGPSVTLYTPSERLTLAPRELGPNPPVARSAADCVASSMNFRS